VNRLIGAGVAALVGLALVSCGAGEPPALKDEPGGGAATAPAPPPTEAPDPASVSIPKIDAESSLIPLGLTIDGELEVPDVREPLQAGWYAGQNKDEPGDEWDPGEPGPAVIAGHIDGLHSDGTKGAPGIFANLSRLAPGDQILVDREDGVQLTFTVYRVEQVSKEHFPTQEVYGATVDPELRLITCGGPFDHAQGHYTENTVVFAKEAAT